jgi:GTP-binding protein
MNSIRNIAIIAHVDHGKTTLVDKIIHECQTIDDRKDHGELILDNNDLERERGITIVSKNVSVNYNGVKINIIDTPGHADFGGEVERVLKMADGVLLLVDAFEGPMPQTRFVLNKAIELGLKPILVVNKVDKENCRPEDVQGDVFDLMFNLGATEDQLDFVTLFGSARDGWMSFDHDKRTTNIQPLLMAIIDNIPEAPYKEGTVQMQITSLDFNRFQGRIAIGRIFRGDMIENIDYYIFRKDGSKKKVRVKEIYEFVGLGKSKVNKLRSGDICALIGLEDFDI